MKIGHWNACTNKTVNDKNLKICITLVIGKDKNLCKSQLHRMISYIEILALKIIAAKSHTKIVTWNFERLPRFFTSNGIAIKLVPVDRWVSGLHAHIFKFSVRQLGAEIWAVENWLLQWLLAPKPLIRAKRNLAWFHC